jgi:hypothetical protein
MPEAAQYLTTLWLSSGPAIENNLSHASSRANSPVVLCALLYAAGNHFVATL